MMTAISIWMIPPWSCGARTTAIVMYGLVFAPWAGTVLNTSHWSMVEMSGALAVMMAVQVVTP